MDKQCDFDLPETPAERLTRGLKIALDGAKAMGDMDGWTKPIQELLDCVQESVQTEIKGTSKNIPTGLFYE